MMKKNTDDLALLQQGYYPPEDDVAEYDPEEAMLIDVFGDYYLDGRYKPVLILGYYDKTAEWDNLHYMLVTGYDENNIYLADSLHNTGRRYYNRKVDRKTFKKMWNTSKTFAVRFFYGRNIYYTYNGGDQT